MFVLFCLSLLQKNSKMIQFNFGFAIVLMLCVHSSVQLTEQTFSKSWTVPMNSNRFMLRANYEGLQERKNNVFHYVFCEGVKTNLLSCNITVETRSPPDSNTLQQHSCNNLLVKPTDESRNLLDSTNMALVPFGANGAVLIWAETPKEVADDSFYYMGVRIVNTLTCENVNVAFPTEQSAFYFSNLPLVVYSDTVDFFVDNKDLCKFHSSEEPKGREQLCRITFDQNGKQIGNPSPFWVPVPHIGYLHPASVHSADKGFFSTYLNADDAELTVSHMQPNGTTRQLTKLKIEGGEEAQVVISNAEGYYGLCWIPASGSTKMSCLQFDSEGDLKLKQSFEFPEKVQWIDVRNQGKSKLLIVSGNCQNGTSSLECQQFKLWTTGSSEILALPEAFDGLDLKCYDTTNGLTVNTDEGSTKNEYCFYFTCIDKPPVNTQDVNKLHFTGKCIIKN